MLNGPAMWREDERERAARLAATAQQGQQIQESQLDRLLKMRLLEQELAGKMQLSAMDGSQRLDLAALNNSSAERQVDQRGYYDQALQSMRDQAQLDQGLQSWGKARDLEGLQNQWGMARERQGQQFTNERQQVANQFDLQKMGMANEFQTERDTRLADIDAERMKNQYGYVDSNNENAAFRQHAIAQDQQFEAELSQLAQASQRFDDPSAKSWRVVQGQLQALEKARQSGALQNRPDDYLNARQQLRQQLREMSFNQQPLGAMDGDVVTQDGIRFAKTAKGYEALGVDPNMLPEDRQKFIDARRVPEKDAMGNIVGWTTFDQYGNPKIVPMPRSGAQGGGSSGGFDPSKEYDATRKLLLDATGEDPAEEDVLRRMSLKQGSVKRVVSGEAIGPTKAELAAMFDAARPANLPPGTSWPTGASLPEDVLRNWMRQKMGAAQPQQNLDAQPLSAPMSQGIAPQSQQQAGMRPAVAVDPAIVELAADPERVQWAKQFVTGIRQRYAQNPNGISQEVRSQLEMAVQLLEAADRRGR